MPTIAELEEKAALLRRHVINMTYEAGSGHPGGSLSAADIITVLYFHKLKHKPNNEYWPERDRFVLSKGHAAPILYAALAESGYFSTDELKSLRKIGSLLQGHPDRTKIPGVEVSTGALGQGLSVAVGMALASKLDKADWHVYAMVGDGECQEGEIWEAAMSAAHYKLDNLTVFLDRNGLQIDGPTEEIMALEPLDDKWKAFGWHVKRINGHDINAIMQAIEEPHPNKPYMIIADTIKGKGVSFMENQVCFHGKAPSKEETCTAMEELACSSQEK